MRLPLFLSSVLTLLLVASACGSDDTDSPFRLERLAVRDTVTHVVALDGRTLVLQAETGQIEVTASDTATVATVRVVRTARGATEGSARERLDQGEVVRVDGDDEIVQLIAPAPQPPGIETAFAATVPREAALHLQLDTGSILLTRAAGAFATAQTGTGSVRAVDLAAADATLRAEDGAIDADLAAWQPGQRLMATTGSGTITLALPAGVRAEVDATAGTGLVRLDELALAEEQRTQSDTGQRVTGRLGAASDAAGRIEAGRIDARAEVGTVRLRRRL